MVGNSKLHALRLGTLLVLGVALLDGAGVGSRAGAAHAAPSLLGNNLIVNGDGEAAPGSSDGDTLVTVPGWTTLMGNFNAVQYDASGFPGAADPGPANRGANFLAGGPDTDESQASQEIDLSALATTVDAGSISYNLSGFLGGYSTQEDHASLTAYFQDGTGATTGTAVIGPVSQADRQGNTGLLSRTATGKLPVHTRKVHLVLDLVRTDGSYDDGYADNLSLVLSQAPAQPGHLTFSPRKLNLGSPKVNTSKSRTVTFRNAGPGSVTVNAGALAAPFSLSGGPSVTVAAGRTATLTVTFTPNVKGKASSTLALTTDDPRLPSVRIPLTGNGK